MNDSVIEIKNLSRRFHKIEALRDVDLQIPRGSVFGLVGENGAGKTTLIKHVLGLLKAKTGTVRVFGLDPVAHPPEVLGRIGYLSEDRDLPGWMRVGELLRYTQAFFPTWDPEHEDYLVRLFGLDLQQRVNDLSRGQKAQMGLTLALAHKPDLLLLDEPSSGLDPVVRRDILSAIIRTVADEGRTVLFSSHLLDEVERVADTVAMIHKGKIVMCDPLDDIKAGYRCVQLRLPTQLKRAPELPGAIAWSGFDRDWTALANGDLGNLKAAAKGIGADVIDERTPALEEIFVMRVKGQTGSEKE